MLKLKPMGRSMWTMVLGLSVLALLGGWYAAWRHFDSPALEQYSALIEQMATHKITGGNDGRVDTSRSFPGLIPGDTAYLTWRDDGSFVVMFPVYFGQGPQLAGLVLHQPPPSRWRHPPARRAGSCRPTTHRRR